MHCPLWYAGMLLFVWTVGMTGISARSITGQVQGSVFADDNQNGLLDDGESPLHGIVVSNGEDVVVSEGDGTWTLPVHDNTEFVFMVKPPQYDVLVNRWMVPQYYYPIDPDDKKLHRQKFDFALVPAEKQDAFKVIVFGDPQARGLREVNFVSHDVVEECIDLEADFGISLGDIVADDPALFEPISASIAQIGVPWYNVFGNHDNDRGAVNDEDSDNTFERFFGPSTYAFEQGEVVFIVYKNIYFDTGGKYRPHFTRKQTQFTENYLHTVPEDKLVVLLMHAPIVACDNREKLFELLDKRPHTFSISGHVHQQLHLFMGEKSGWNGENPHHHLINATVSGSWWCGLKDELGIPHATMNDGGPNGYSIVSFDGNTYDVRFKAARRPANYQMNIYLPDDIALSAVDTTKVLVNVFAGSPRSAVDMRVDKKGDWLPLSPVKTVDPACLQMHQLNPYLDEEVLGMPLDEVFGWKMDYPSMSHHMWEAPLPATFEVGTHVVTIRHTDMFGKVWIDHRIFRIIEEPSR
jgi:hypothetical protein